MTISKNIKLNLFAFVTISIAYLSFFVIPDTDAQSLSFTNAPESPYYVGFGSAFDVEVADFNLDGWQDFAVILNDVHDIKIYINDGDGTFTETARYDTLLTPYSIAEGDFDGNIYPDIVIADLQNSVIEVFLNDGTGGFLAPTSYYSGNWPFEVTVGDLDGQCGLDIVSVNATSQDVAVHFNNCDGTFQPRVQYRVGDTPVGVEVADLDLQNGLDIVVSNQHGRTVGVLLNDGTGNFGAHTEYSIGYAPTKGRVGLINADEYPDFVAPSSGSSNVTIMLNDGNGSLSVATTITDGDWTGNIAIGDLDNDGCNDIAVTNNRNNTVTVLTNSGDGINYDTLSPLPVGVVPIGLDLGDADSDGDLDIFVASENDTVTLLLNQLNPTGTTPVECGTPLPKFNSNPLSGSTITLTGETGTTQFATLSISNTGDAGSLLDVSQVGTLSNFSINTLPQDLTPADGTFNIEIACVVPQASETLVLQTNETGNPTYSYTLECIADDPTPEVTPEITAEPTEEVTPEATPESDIVTICHVAGLADDPANYIILELPLEALNGHFDNNGTPLAGHEDDFLIVTDEDAARCGVDNEPESDANANDTSGSAPNNAPEISVFDPAISKIGFLLPGQVGVTGEQLEWIVTVSNTGNVVGQNVTVTDTLVDALRVDSVNAPGGVVSINGQTVTVTYSVLNVGETQQFSIITTVLQGVEVNNTACVNATNQASSECATGNAIVSLPQTGENPVWRNWLWLLLIVPLAGLAFVRRRLQQP